uniref:Uncharacterized protein n=1 Tax=Ditylenchus dipsaci TaxID=166011 RepID=A0A915D141_9BILA
MAPLNLNYLPYLNLFWAVLSIIFQFIAISAMSYLLYCAWSKGPQLRSSSLSSSMKIYLTYHIICCTLCLPFHVPVFMRLIPATSSIIIDAYLAYYINIPVGLYYYLNPVPLFFLTLDRCFVLIAPFLLQQTCPEVLPLYCYFFHCCYGGRQSHGSSAYTTD